MIRKATALLTLLAATSVSAANDTRDLYFSVTGYAGELDTGVSALTGTATLDEEDSAFAITIGTEILPRFSVEGFYLDGGSATLSGNNGDTWVLDGTAYSFTANGVSITSDTTAWGLVGKYDFVRSNDDKLNIYGKAGFSSWESEFSLAVSGISASLPKQDGTDAVYGFGADYWLTDSVAIRADWTKVEDWTGIGLGLVFTPSK